MPVRHAAASAFAAAALAGQVGETSLRPGGEALLLLLQRSEMAHTHAIELVDAGAHAAVAPHVFPQPLAVTRAARAGLKAQHPCVVWFTGLSGAGKSTIANLLERRLLALGHHAYLLDGDNVRRGLTRDLGFSQAERAENVRRIAEVAALMLDAGLVVLVACISPTREERRRARAIVGDGEFLEIFVDTPLAVAEQRDPKGLYRKARRGELREFTGIGSPYEPPDEPDVRIDTTRTTAEQACARILRRLRQFGIGAHETLPDAVAPGLPSAGLACRLP